MLALGKHAKVSTVTSLSALRLRGQRKNEIQTASKGKTDSANMYNVGLEHTCKNVRDDFYIRPIVKGSKVEKRSNGKTNSDKMLALNKFAEVFMVTSSSDLQVREQRSI